MGIFDLLGNLFGYVLWFFFDATSNYALAIILFTVVINIILFPFAIKRQKSMAAQARLAEKQKELQKKYGNNRQKFAEEQAKLYEQEGVSPFSGCLAMFLPLILLMGIYGTITKPLQNTLHIDQDKINSAVSVVASISENDAEATSNLNQLHLVKVFKDVKPHLTMFNEEELADIEEYSSGFNFMGLNLLDTPRNSPFTSMLWIIPVLTFIFSAVSMYFSQKLSGTAVQAQGAMKYFPYVMFLFTAYLANSFPGAVGLYWIINTIIGFVQNVILGKYFNVHTLNAKDEAVRFETIRQYDKNVRQIRNPGEVVLPETNVVPFAKRSKKNK